MRFTPRYLHFKLMQMPFALYIQHVYMLISGPHGTFTKRRNDSHPKLVETHVKTATHGALSNKNHVRQYVELCMASCSHANLVYSQLPPLIEQANP